MKLIRKIYTEEAISVRADKNNLCSVTCKYLDVNSTSVICEKYNFKYLSYEFEQKANFITLAIFRVKECINDFGTIENKGE